MASDQMKKENKEVKVSLELLKKFVSELERTMIVSDTILSEKKEGTVNDYVIEMSKAMGLAAGIAKEATLLVADCKVAIKINSSPTAGTSTTQDDLADLLGVLGGSGSGLPGSN